jgi:hypothetical protein
MATKTTKSKKESRFSVGDRVQATESAPDTDRGETVPVKVVGEVVEVLPAREVYTRRPRYSAVYRKLSTKNPEDYPIKDYQDAADDFVYRVQVDGETQGTGDRERAAPPATSASLS